MHWSFYGISSHSPLRPRASLESSHLGANTLDSFTVQLDRRSPAQSLQVIRIRGLTAPIVRSHISMETASYCQLRCRTGLIK